MFGLSFEVQNYDLKMLDFLATVSARQNNEDPNVSLDIEVQSIK